MAEDCRFAGCNPVLTMLAFLWLQRQSQVTKQTLRRNMEHKGDVTTAHSPARNLQPALRAETDS
jgi:hypothetical protein